MQIISKFVSKYKNMPVGNGQYVSVFFITTVIKDTHGYRFQIFTLVSEIQDSVDLVLGKKEIFSKKPCFIFLNRQYNFPLKTRLYQNQGNKGLLR